jgi:hypothetical protein
MLRIYDMNPDPRIHPLTNGSGSCYFRRLHSRRQQKTNFLKFFCLLLLKVHLHHFSIKSQKEADIEKESTVSVPSWNQL